MYTRRLRSYAKERTKRAALQIYKWICLKKRSWVRNTIDPLSRDVLEPPVFKHVSAFGYTTGFNAPLLVEYLVSSGNFTHPETRVPFLPCELTRLQRVSQTTVNLIGQQAVLEQKRRDMLETQSVAEFMENAIKTTLCQILAWMSSQHSDNEILYRCLLFGFPDLFSQLDQHAEFLNDEHRCKQLNGDLLDTISAHATQFPGAATMCKLIHNILMLRLTDMPVNYDFMVIG